MTFKTIPVNFSFYVGKDII